MKLRDQPPVHLAYCLNIHPGESWEDNFRAIEEKALAVRRAVYPGKAFALGLRLGINAARTLSDRNELAGFRDFLAANRLYVFTVNGFPYGSFHGARIKESVYRPDWRSRERLDYTRMLADILAALLPEGAKGSISTLPGSYKEWIKSAGDFGKMVDNLVSCAEYLSALYGKTGREICLALEPEPDCFLETTTEAVSFLEKVHTAAGKRNLRGLVGRHIGICVDTCHMAVQFEDLAESLSALRKSGIRVPKIQLSAAISAQVSRKSADELGAFIDDVYLHQVKVRRPDKRIVSYRDLTREFLERLKKRGGGELRTHFHVPLYFEGSGSLVSTASCITPEFLKMVLGGGESFLEIETYTYSVLPAELRARDVMLSIADEYRWVMKRVKSAATSGTTDIADHDMYIRCPAGSRDC